MAEVRPFRALRYDAARVDAALNIAPPYDVISAELQADLYRRSESNIVRVEYGQRHAVDSAADNRYTRAARDLSAWRSTGVLARDREPAIYAYRLEFAWEGRAHLRHHYFALVRLEEWDKGVVKPHEHTLSGPKADRLDLLKATRTQVSPVYCLYRSRDGTSAAGVDPGTTLYDFESDKQRHTISVIGDRGSLAALGEFWRSCDVYIADGHHRYETALAYRDECRTRASAWSGEEPENFVLMAMSDAADAGLLVLPTHRLVAARPHGDLLARIGRLFRVDEVTGPTAQAAVAAALERIAAMTDTAAFVAIGLTPGATQVLTLADRSGVERLMPPAQPDAWKKLDVSVLQYGILLDAFGIDDAALTSGGAVTYTQDAGVAVAEVRSGAAASAFLLNATPVDQVLAVADAGGRMPQKSTFFHPKLPTGLVLNALDT